MVETMDQSNPNFVDNMLKPQALDNSIEMEPADISLMNTNRDDTPMVIDNEPRGLFQSDYEKNWFRG
jgi:hypothetical protein